MLQLASRESLSSESEDSEGGTFSLGVLILRRGWYILRWVGGMEWQAVQSGGGKLGIGSHIAKSSCHAMWQAMGLSPVMDFQEWPGCQEWPTSSSCHVIQLEVFFQNPSQCWNLGTTGLIPLPISGITPGHLSSSSFSLSFFLHLQHNIIA